MRATSRGFTLIETAVVLAIVALLALPLSALLTQYLHGTTFSTQDITAQTTLNSIAAVMEKGLRTATRTNGNDIDLSVANAVTFDFLSPISNVASLPQVSTTSYALKADGLFYVNGTVYPDGLAAGTVTNLSFPTGVDKQQLNTSPYFITFRIEATNATAGTNVFVEKTVLLQDY